MLGSNLKTQLDPLPGAHQTARRIAELNAKAMKDMQLPAQVIASDQPGKTTDVFADSAKKFG